MATAIKDDKDVGNGMSRRQAKKIRMATMNKSEIAYLRRKAIVEKVWPFFRFFILFGLCFVILYPLIYMISCAFRDPSDMNDPTVMWIPRNLTLKVIKDTMTAMDFWNTLKTTLLLNIGCSLVQVCSCALAGYGFARFRFKGKSLLFGIVILMILVPSQVIAIPQYQQFRNFLGNPDWSLINNPLSMYLPALTCNGIRAGLMIFIFRQFFKGLPKELEDAAYLDGCGPLRTFVQIMIPNAFSSFLTVFLFSIVWYWNDYYVSSTFFTNNQTIALMLKNLGTQLNNTVLKDQGTLAFREQIVWMEAGCLISILPILIMYAFLQKHFTEGIERSGLVG